MADNLAALEASLAHLERLQTQVRHTSPTCHGVNALTIRQLDTLRSTVPSLVSPLIKPQSSKAQMFAEVKKSAVTTTSQLAAFRNDCNSVQTQQMFTKAQESEQRDPDLSKSEEIPRFGWSEKGLKEN